MEVDCIPEPLPIPETSRRSFDGLNDAVDTFEARVGEPESLSLDDAGEMLSKRSHRA